MLSYRGSQKARDDFLRTLEVKGASAEQRSKAGSRYRVHKECSPAAAQLLDKHLLSFLPEGLAPLPDASLPAEVKASSAASVFGISKNFELPSHELNWQSCFRVSFKGERLVTMVRVVDLLDYGSDIKDKTLAELKKYFQNLSAEMMSTLFGGKSSTTLWSAMIGPGDVLWTPYGMLIFELVGAELDVIGARRGFHFLEQQDEVNKVATALAKFLGAPFQPGENLLECMKAAGAAGATAKAEPATAVEAPVHATEPAAVEAKPDAPQGKNEQEEETAAIKEKDETATDAEAASKLKQQKEDAAARKKEEKAAAAAAKRAAAAAAKREESAMKRASTLAAPKAAASKCKLFSAAEAAAAKAKKGTEAKATEALAAGTKLAEAKGVSGVPASASALVPGTLMAAFGIKK